MIYLLVDNEYEHLNIFIIICTVAESLKTCSIKSTFSITLSLKEIWTLHSTNNSNYIKY